MYTKTYQGEKVGKEQEKYEKPKFLWGFGINSMRDVLQEMRGCTGNHNHGQNTC